jgi:phosphoglycerate-specific signal transduction histidine kinase
MEVNMTKDELLVKMFNAYEMRLHQDEVNYQFYATDFAKTHHGFLLGRITNEQYSQVTHIFLAQATNYCEKREQVAKEILEELKEPIQQFFPQELAELKAFPKKGKDAMDVFESIVDRMVVKESDMPT